MKKLISVTLAVLLYTATQSQKTTIRFEGFNNSSDKNYSVDIGGRKFYSSGAQQTGTSGVRTIEINYLSSGAHDLAVYEATNRAQPIYSKSFHLRPDHNMVITIRNNGQVAFYEKQIQQNTEAKNSDQFTNARQPLSMPQFEKLFRAIKNQYTESERYAVLNEALDVSTNYFSIYQLTQLLSLITPESNRLVLAKKSSTHLLEEANSAALLEVFGSKENRDELERYLSGKN